MVLYLASVPAVLLLYGTVGRVLYTCASACLRKVDWSDGSELIVDMSYCYHAAACPVLTHSLARPILIQMSYGMGLASIMNAFIDREKMYTEPLSKVLPKAIVSLLPPSAASFETTHFGVILWTTLCTVMVTLSIIRVLTHVKKPKVMVYAICKLFSPFMLGVCLFLLPSDVLYDSARYISLSVGLAYCLITVKLIFLSMAKMPYAVFQCDILPMVLVCLWVRSDERLTLLGAKTLFQVCTVWYLYRFLKWSAVACHQICDRLDINIFKIKTKKE